MPAPRVIVVPRWGATPHDDWYPWLRRALGARADVAVCDLPEPDEPVIRRWVPHVAAAVGREPAALARTVLVGHSVGCQALLHVLGGLGAPVRGTLCVAGWWRVDAPWPSLQPWLRAAEGHDLAAVRAAAGRLAVLLSDNDPFTADAEANARLWTERLGARVRVVPGAEHFNHAEAPAVLETLERLLAAGEGGAAPPP